MWKSGEQTLEAAKVAHEVFQYCRGRVFDVGCGTRKVFPGRGVTGIDNNRHGEKNPPTPDIVGDAAKLDIFSDSSADCVFSSHVLDQIEDYKAALSEWWRLVKVGGYLVLYLGHAHYRPCRGMPGASERTLHDFLPEVVTEAMREVAWRSGKGWDQLRDEVRTRDDEYSFLQVYRKRGTVVCNGYVAPKAPKKSLGIMRLGAYGDALWISPLLPHLRAEFDEIVLYTGEQGETVLRHDPHIDRIVVLPRYLLGWDDEENRRRGFKTPGELLVGITQKLAGKHDRMLNLIGTVEGSLLPHPSHVNYWLPDETRRAVVAHNYLEVIHRAAGVPFNRQKVRVQFYPTDEERNWAVAERAKHTRFVVISPTGSSLPKHWPHSQKAMELFSEQGVAGIVVGDMRGQKYQAPPGWQVVGTDWPIRRVFALAALADVVVGTESAVLNSVSHEAPLKIALLSHSTHLQLTRDWTRTISTAADGLKCYPCHRIHPDWTRCTVDRDTGAASCQASVSAEIVVEYAMQWMQGEMVDDDLHGVLAEVA